MPSSASGGANSEKQAESFGMKDGEQADLSTARSFSQDDDLSFCACLTSSLLLGGMHALPGDTEQRVISVVIDDSRNPFFSFVKSAYPFVLRATTFPPSACTLSSQH
jgi:hypothetical protein